MSDLPVSIVELFLQRASTTPEKSCLSFEGESVTYGELRQRVEQLAAALLGWGLRPGERVALFMDNSPDFVALYLATHLARGVIVPINIQYRQVELRHILQDAGVRLCFVDGTRRAELERLREGLPALEEVIESGPALAALAAQGGPTPHTLPDGEELAAIPYTSGTTGRSKGAMLLHRNQVANIRAVLAAWQWTAVDHLLLTLPLFHVHGLMVGLHGTLVAGASVELYRRFDAPTVYDRLTSGQVTLFFGVPTMYVRLLAEAATRGVPPAHTPRLCVSGSAPLSPQTFEAFERHFSQRILERYGMTETLMNLTNPYDGERRPGTVGQPFPGQEARVVDLRSRRPLPAEEHGEIEVRGPHLFAGYWQQPRATAERFSAEGWFRTGDLGAVSADGYFMISGRASELIISGGYNVYPREVEEVLERFPGVTEVAVVGLPEPELGEQVVAAIVREDPALREDELIAFCREQLASFKKPRRIFFVERLPRNALGKVQKHLLRVELAGAAD